MKENLINHNDNSLPTFSNEINFEGLNKKSTGSQEKILTLPKAYKIWYRTCTIFAISLIIFVTSIVLLTTLKDGAFGTGIAIVGIGILYCFVFVTCCNGFLIVNPNEAVVFQYYGRYMGTVKENGYIFIHPLATKQRISLRSNQ